MIDFYCSYKSFKCNSIYKGIPIAELDGFRRVMARQGKFYRIRYRGPRNEIGDNRPKHRRQQDCLKRFAKTFSVYLY